MSGSRAPRAARDSEPPERLAQRLRHVFRDPGLLRTALTHASRAHEEGEAPGNERLEFLGDAVLDLVVAELLFTSRPDWREGELTRARAALVNTRALAARARALELARYARLGRTEQHAGAQKDRVLANLFEALVGALYLDGGLGTVRAFLAEAYAEALAREGEVPPRDPKTRLQEWTHARLRTTPAYRLLADSGVEDDAERFRVEVRIGEAALGEGRARSKREAEREAAEAALARLEAPGTRRGDAK